jgi:hypothetical protein
MILSNASSRYHKAILGKIGENNYEPIVIDDDSHALLGITAAHFKIHAGLSFTTSYSVTTDATDGHRSAIYIKTPVGKEFHMVASFSAGTAADLSIGEAPTIASNVGTHGVPIFNRNRKSLTESGCFDNATAPLINTVTTLTEAQIAGDGTFDIGLVLRNEPLTAGDGPKPAGGSTRGSQEYILLEDTAYIFMLQNTTAAANAHHIDLDYYLNLNVN